MQNIILPIVCAIHRQESLTDIRDALFLLQTKFPLVVDELVL
jgi:hypothetical protein